MPKEAVFTMKLELELRDEFMAETKAAHRPASQVVREMMREFVRRQREAREHEEVLRRKVERARASMRTGRGRLNEEVEAESTGRRVDLQREAGKARTSTAFRGMVGRRPTYRHPPGASVGSG